jgi:hypothetical protein
MPTPPAPLLVLLPPPLLLLLLLPLPLLFAAPAAGWLPA